jgi:hypothetical protein
MNPREKICPHSPIRRKRRHFRKQALYLFFQVTLLFLFLPTEAQNAIPPIGQWREHLNYQNTIQVVRGDRLYIATQTNVFSLDADNEIERYSKVTGLNDIGVQCIGWDQTTQQLLIAYNNSNLDALKGSSVRNIGDIKRSTVSGNKTINNIYCLNGLAYLSSGLGVIVVNLTKYEISDTWYIGTGGGRVSVNGFTSDGASFYAATGEGLKKASTTNLNLSNYSNWQNISSSNGLPGGAVKNVISVNGRVVVQKADSLLIQTGTSWSHLYADPAWPIVSVTGAENKLLVCQRSALGTARVVVLSTSGIIEKQFSQSGIISFPRSAISDNGIIWIADQFGGLSKNGTERFVPNGPPGPASEEMVVNNNTLYVAAGSVSSAWNYQYNRNGIYFLKDDQWTFKGYYNTPVLDSALDFITLATDPSDGSLWAGSFGGGLANFKTDGKISLYKQGNSTLQPAIGDPGSYRVSGLAFDQNNNLWVSNYGAAQNLQVRKADGSWRAFSIPFSHLENAVSQIVVDDLNQIWIVSPKDNGLFCFSYGQNIDNTSDDHWKFYRQGPGNGNLPGNNVLSILKEKNGFIWVGTDRGIGIIQCTGEVFTPQSCEATLPIIQQGNFAGLFFKDEQVQCMTIDGANRKWIGTKNGVWLVSEDGEKILYRFTEENSPLLSNDVKKITVDPVSGEVFISTFNGICSFRSTATAEATANNNIVVFPNPIPPGYNGSIAIKGLTGSALIKIAELNGRLVYQTRALGGQAIWDGRNYKGDKVASGVYLVVIRDDTGADRVVAKIVVISGR